MDEVRTPDGRAVVFCCAACNAPLTKPLVQAPLNMDAKAPYESENRQPLGTYALDPEPFGPPYVPAPDDRIGHRNVHVPGGPHGTFVIAPDDALPMDPVPDPRRRSGCCGPSGSDGLNLRCPSCAAEVATECADCWTYQEIVWTLAPSSLSRTAELADQSLSGRRPTRGVAARSGCAAGEGLSVVGENRPG